MIDSEHPGRLGCIRPIGIAHPDPDPAILILHSVSLDASDGGNLVLPWYLDDLAGRIKEKTMVHAAKMGALASAKREWRQPMNATIFEGM
jgi:hypothetical protein